MGLEENFDGGVVRVVAGEVAIGVDDRVHRLDGRGGGRQLVHERDDVFLPGHRDSAPPDAQTADPRDRLGDARGRERLVDEIEAQCVIEVVVEARPRVSRTSGEGDAEAGVLGEVSGNGAHGAIISGAGPASGRAGCSHRIGSEAGLHGETARLDGRDELRVICFGLIGIRAGESGEGHGGGVRLAQIAGDHRGA